MQTEIIPAILPTDFDEIVDKVALVKGLVKTVQIDICDGKFVPSRTWPYERDIDEMFEKMLTQDIGMPEWEEVDYEFDLMMNYGDVGDIEKWIQLGAVRLVIHVESKGDLKTIIGNVHDKVELGLALDMNTAISAIEPYIDQIKFVQLMGIDKIGYQGQEFDPKVIEKIKVVRAQYPSLVISIDGGVSTSNAKQLVEAGANRLVVGSAIFESEDVEEVILQLGNNQ